MGQPGRARRVDDGGHGNYLNELEYPRIFAVLEQVKGTKEIPLDNFRGKGSVGHVEAVVAITTFDSS
jgi:hypothetical protein